MGSRTSSFSHPSIRPWLTPLHRQYLGSCSLTSISSSHSPCSSFFVDALSTAADAGADTASPLSAFATSLAILAACFRLADGTLKLPGGRPRRLTGSCGGGTAVASPSGSRFVEVGLARSSSSGAAAGVGENKD